MAELLVKLFIHTLAQVVGKHFVEYFAVEATCAATKKCPKKLEALKKQMDDKILEQNGSTQNPKEITSK
jgi:hypothetical protein